eukprot:PhF_6_TR38675/c0_g1_i1/m.57860
MEQWIIDGRDLINKRYNKVSRISPEFIQNAEANGWVDLSGVRGLYKKVLREGTGENPKVYAEVTANYRYIIGGVTVDDQGEAPMDFVVGGGAVTQAMEEGAISMKKGELALFTVDPAFAFRDEGFSSKKR